MEKKGLFVYQTRSDRTAVEAAKRGLRVKLTIPCFSREHKQWTIRHLYCHASATPGRLALIEGALYFDAEDLYGDDYIGDDGIYVIESRCDCWRCRGLSAPPEYEVVTPRAPKQVLGTVPEDEPVLARRPPRRQYRDGGIFRYKGSNIPVEIIYDGGMPVGIKAVINIRTTKATGWSYCSLDDEFDYKKGCCIACQRALTALEALPGATQRCKPYRGTNLKNHREILWPLRRIEQTQAPKAPKAPKPPKAN